MEGVFLCGGFDVMRGIERRSQRNLKISNWRARAGATYELRQLAKRICELTPIPAISTSSLAKKCPA